MRGFFLLFVELLWLSSHWSPNVRAATVEEAPTMHGTQENAVPLNGTNNAVRIVKPEGGTMKNAVEKTGVVCTPSLPHGNQKSLLKEKATWNLRGFFGRVSRSIAEIGDEADQACPEADQTRPETVGSISVVESSSTQGYPGKHASTYAGWGRSSRSREHTVGKPSSRDALERPKTNEESHDISSNRINSVRIVGDACDDEEELLQQQSELNNKRDAMEALSSSASLLTERKAYNEEPNEMFFSLTSASRRDGSRPWIKVGEELVWPESLSSKDGTSQLLAGMDGTIMLSMDNLESGGGVAMERLDSVNERAQKREEEATESADEGPSKESYDDLVILARPKPGAVEEALAQRWTRRIESQANKKDMHASGGVKDEGDGMAWLGSQRPTLMVTNTGGVEVIIDGVKVLSLPTPRPKKRWIKHIFRRVKPIKSADYTLHVVRDGFEVRLGGAVVWDMHALPPQRHESGVDIGGAQAVRGGARSLGTKVTPRHHRRRAW